MSWQSLTTRKGNKPKFHGRKRGRPAMAKNKKTKGTHKDDTQDAAIMSVQRQVNKLKKIEYKVADEFNGSISIPTTGVLAIPCSPNPRVGNTNLQRIGNKIFATSWQLKLAFLPSPLVQGPTRVRCMVFIDTEFDRAPPDITTGAPFTTRPTALLDTSVITDSTLAPRNINVVERFKVLYDKMFLLTPTAVFVSTLVGAVTTTNQFADTGKLIKLNIRLNRQIGFIGDAGTTADIHGPCPVIAWFGDQTVNPPLVEYSSRLIYKDS